MTSTITIQPKVKVTFGHPWLYSNQLVSDEQSKKIASGSLVRVDRLGRFYAWGYFNRHSLIACRLLSFHEHEVIDLNWVSQKIKAAVTLRQQFFSQDFYRLIHAEADGLPGIVIDRFDKIFVVQLNTSGAMGLSAFVIEAIQTLFNPETIVVEYDQHLLEKEGVERPESYVIGKPTENLLIKENGLNYHVPFDFRQKTGWFFDHRENRKLVADLSANKNVLDCYAYAGGFGLLAAANNAKKVVMVDRSKQVSKNIENTAASNQLKNIQVLCGEVFEVLTQLEKQPEKFDVIVLDPPAFVKTKKDKPQGLKGYEKLLKMALPLLAPNGIILLASCSYHVNLEDLYQIVASASLKINRECKILKHVGSSPCHPKHPLLPEVDYLKGVLLYFPSV